MLDCIFCKIANKEIDSQIVFEDDKMVAFKDLSPQAPVHLLIIPKKHIQSLADVSEDDVKLLGEMLIRVKKLAEEFELENGYRTVINTRGDGGQTVDHLHIHLLGKRKMQWPPG